MFKLKHQDRKARTGILKTNHGNVKTPFLMPVATKTAVRYLDNESLEKIGIQAIIANSFILSLRPGADLIEKLGGIHKFTSFKKTIFTDSGGFQKKKQELFSKIDEQGIHFKSPFDGTKHLLTPEKAMEQQYKIGADVAMVIDDMPLYGSSKTEVAKATHTTHEWAYRCINHHKQINKKKQLLFGIAQGGVFKDLREKSAKFISSLDFDGVAFGGLAIGETSKETYEMVNHQVKFFPENKTRYLMGVGSPSEILNAISAGVDCFDSTFPTQNARHGTMLTMKGRVRIMQDKYKHDKTPIDKDCNCVTCQRYSKAYIRYLLKMDQANGYHLATYHNIYFYNQLMEEIRLAIKEGRFKKLKKQILKYY
jgi:queuine tRNA-ribosyltransferase